MKKYIKYLRILIILLSITLALTQINLTNMEMRKKFIDDKISTIQITPSNDTIEKITVDHAFSIGGWCICAEYLERYGLRQTSSPLDWMRKYSLNVVARLFETKFKNFFKNIVVTSKKNTCKNRTVYDITNHIESIHFVPSDAPFDEEYKKFKETMQKRAQKMDSILSNSKSVLLLNCRNNPETTDQNSTDRELKQFAKRFSKVYPNLQKIYLMDIHNDQDETIRQRIIQQDKKIKIIQYRFKNIDKSFIPAWTGNQSAWHTIMENIKLK